MKLPFIKNSLLRIDNVTGEPPAPFELPNKNLDFWVLELPSGDDIAFKRWRSRTIRILSGHEKVLSKLRRRGAQLTIFIQYAPTNTVLHLDSGFLRVLADLGISLECFQPDN